MIGLKLEDVNKDKEYKPFPGSRTDIFILDEPGAGGAYHQYQVCSDEENDEELLTVIDFQEGPIQENGVNGCQIEDLLSICQHRLECFQVGNFACPENQEALDSIKTALAALYKRTQARAMRSVEGQSIV